MYIFYPVLSHKILNLKMNYMLASHSTWKRLGPFLFQYKVTNILLQSLQHLSGINKVQTYCRASWSLPKSLTLSLAILFWLSKPQRHHFSWSRKTLLHRCTLHILIPLQEHLPWVLSLLSKLPSVLPLLEEHSLITCLASLGINESLLLGYHVHAPIFPYKALSNLLVSKSAFYKRL